MAADLALYDPPTTAVPTEPRRTGQKSNQVGPGPCTPIYPPPWRPKRQNQAGRALAPLAQEGANSTASSQHVLHSLSATSARNASRHSCRRSALHSVGGQQGPSQPRPMGSFGMGRPGEYVKQKRKHDMYIYIYIHMYICTYI